MGTWIIRLKILGGHNYYFTTKCSKYWVGTCPCDPYSYEPAFKISIMIIHSINNFFNVLYYGKILCKLKVVSLDKFNGRIFTPNFKYFIEHLCYCVTHKSFSWKQPEFICILSTFAPLPRFQGRAACIFLQKFSLLPKCTTWTLKK